jgi:hypothetical protein
VGVSEWRPQGGGKSPCLRRLIAKLWCCRDSEANLVLDQVFLAFELLGVVCDIGVFLWRRKGEKWNFEERRGVLIDFRREAPAD